jgi:sec-independent protein translocase protein TatB
MTLAGWLEILCIGLLAFVIIGPKDLPKILFTLGRFIQTLRSLSQEFMSEFQTIHHLKELEDKKPEKSKKKV